VRIPAIICPKFAETPAIRRGTIRALLVNAADAEIELSRLWSRHLDLQRQRVA